MQTVSRIITQVFRSINAQQRSAMYPVAPSGAAAHSDERIKEECSLSADGFKRLADLASTTKTEHRRERGDSSTHRLDIPARIPAKRNLSVSTPPFACPLVLSRSFGLHGLSLFCVFFPYPLVR